MSINTALKPSLITSAEFILLHFLFIQWKAPAILVQPDTPHRERGFRLARVHGAIRRELSEANNSQFELKLITKGIIVSIKLPVAVNIHLGRGVLRWYAPANKRRQTLLGIVTNSKFGTHNKLGALGMKYDQTFFQLHRYNSNNTRINTALTTTCKKGKRDN